MLTACVSVDREERIEYRYASASRFGVVEGIDYVPRPRVSGEDVRVGIRMDDGSYRVLIAADDPHLRIGDRVTVEGDHIYFR